MMIFQVCIQFGVMFTYSTELFDTKVRVLGISSLYTTSKVLSGLGTFVIYLMDKLHLHAMAFIWVFGLIALICSFFLAETKNRGIMN